MKKSRYVASILRGAGVVVLALPMAACDRGEQTVGEQDVKIYSTVEACQADADPPACEAARNQAIAEHREKAPRYATSEQCKTENKDCEEVRTSSGGSFFMPAMMGFMMGRMMSGGGGYGFGSRPVYYDRQGYATTTDRRLGTPSAPITGGVTSVRAPVTAGGDIGTRSATVSRGGFGGSSSGFSSAS
jgi:uncharacterized protein YgiB involved in biofilm formation